MKLRDRSVSVRTQVISKTIGRYKVVKTLGCATMIPFIENISKKFSIENPIVIVDSGLLSKKNFVA